MYVHGCSRIAACQQPKISASDEEWFNSSFRSFAVLTKVGKFQRLSSTFMWCAAVVYGSQSEWEIATRIIYGELALVFTSDWVCDSLIGRKTTPVHEGNLRTHKRTNTEHRKHGANLCPETLKDINHRPAPSRSIGRPGHGWVKQEATLWLEWN